MSDKVSCLVCVHSQDKRLDEMLVHGIQSVINQTKPVDEIVVVLDECWQHTRNQLLHHYADDIKIVSKDKKEGLAKAKNYGLFYCKGDWITYLDADDAWMPCKNEVQLDFINAQREQGWRVPEFIGTLAWDRWPVEDTHPCKWPLKPSCFKPGQYQYHRQIVERLMYENVMCHGSMMIRREVLDEMGGYEDVKGREDWFLWQMAVGNGHLLHNIPERLYIWSHGTSVPR